MRLLATMAETRQHYHAGDGYLSRCTQHSAGDCYCLRSRCQPDESDAGDCCLERAKLCPYRTRFRALLRDQEFIEAARAIGASDATLSSIILFPTLWHRLLCRALGVAGAILSTAGLRFIGLGIQPPEPEWGAMLAGGRNTCVMPGT